MTGNENTMYFPVELWMIIKELMLEPKWKKIGRKTFVKQIDLLNNYKIDGNKYNSSEVYLFNTWDFHKKTLFWRVCDPSPLKLPIPSH